MRQLDKQQIVEILKLSLKLDFELNIWQSDEDSIITVELFVPLVLQTNQAETIVQ